MSSAMVSTSGSTTWKVNTDTVLQHVPYSVEEVVVQVVALVSLPRHRNQRWYSLPGILWVWVWLEQWNCQGKAAAAATASHEKENRCNCSFKCCRVSLSIFQYNVPLNMPAFMPCGNTVQRSHRWLRGSSWLNCLSQASKQHRLKRYHSQTYVNGSKCDLNGNPRETEVRVRRRNVWCTSARAGWLTT